MHWYISVEPAVTQNCVTSVTNRRPEKNYLDLGSSQPNFCNFRCQYAIHKSSWQKNCDAQNGGKIPHFEMDSVWKTCFIIMSFSIQIQQSCISMCKIFKMAELANKNANLNNNHNNILTPLSNMDDGWMDGIGVTNGEIKVLVPCH